MPIVLKYESLNLLELSESVLAFSGIDLPGKVKKSRYKPGVAQRVSGS
jgi:hypothetical protein